MRGLALITVDGVLRDPSTSNPILDGVDLYNALSYVYRLAVIVEQPGDETWLELHGFAAHQYTVTRRPEDPVDPAICRLRQVERIRGFRENLRLVVDPDPGVAATLFRIGVPVLHFVQPAYARPEYAPDYEAPVTPWDEMVRELDRVRALRAADRRIQEEI